MCLTRVLVVGIKRMPDVDRLVQFVYLAAASGASRAGDGESREGSSDDASGTRKQFVTAVTS